MKLSQRICLAAAIIGGGALATSNLSAAVLTPQSSLQEGLAFYANFDKGGIGSYDSYTSGDSTIPGWGGGKDPTFGNGGAFGSVGYNPIGSNVAGSVVGENISTQNFTLSFQFKNLTLSNNKYALWMTTSVGQKLQFETLTGGTAGQLQLHVSEGETGYVGATGSLAGTTDNWQTLTVTSSAEGISLYLNGQKVAGVNKTLLTGNLDSFQFGYSEVGNAGTGSLNVDDFALWNRVLTDEEIAFIASNPAGKPMPTIPEPSAFGLLAGLGALALVVSRRRRKKV